MLKSQDLTNLYYKLISTKAKKEKLDNQSISRARHISLIKAEFVIQVLKVVNCREFNLKAVKFRAAKYRAVVKLEVKPYVVRLARLAKFR